MIATEANPGFRCVWQIDAILGEGPIWVVGEQALFWVDIVGQLVHRYSPGDGARRSWRLDQPITGLAERSSGGFVATTRDGFAFLDLATASAQPIASIEEHLDENRFNDLAVDPHGRLWAGTMDEGEVCESGSLYRLDADLSVRILDTPYIITNGPAFSPDGSVAYHTDTIKREIYAFDLDAQGDIRGKRLWLRLTGDDDGAPDGMAVDREGYVWLAHFGGSRVTRWTPDGELSRVLEMPVPNITSCAFGGPELETLFITTARFHLGPEDLERYPLAGSLFAIEPGVRGLPTHPFAG